MMKTTMFLEWNRTEQIIPTVFIKCIRWQAEETLDPLLCPHHYYCDRTYPISYPPVADTCIILFTVTSYLITLATMVIEIISFSVDQAAHQTRLRRLIKRYFLPSSPISLSLVLFTAAQFGNRIDAMCPMGPAIFHLVLISAIAFTDTDISDIKHAFFDLSIMSGILHLCLDLDSILVPYYTGYDALLSSTLSGECDSCMCRQEALVVGGTVVSYRAWSMTAFLVVGVLFFRIICRSASPSGKFAQIAIINVVKHFLIMLALVFIVVDSGYLLRHSPPERVALRVVAFGAQLIFICLHVLSTIQRLQCIRKSRFLQEKHLTA